MAKTVLRLPEENIYSNGYIIDLGDGRQLLKTDPIQYTPSAEKDLTYTFKEGDRIWDLAYRYYGNSKWWHVITYVNNIVEPFQIPIGTVLLIPDLDVIKATR